MEQYSSTAFKTKIIGVVDRLTKETATGWAHQVGNLHGHLIVKVVVNGVRIASAAADRFRQDLKDASIGDGHHAFSISFDQPLSKEEFDSVIWNHIRFIRLNKFLDRLLEADPKLS